MEAKQGDRIVIRGRTVESPDRHGEILDVRGVAGGPPYVIRFDDGNESVVQPGPDFTIEHTEHV
ncbi:MAG: DUF1918 domain-containing protein [Lacisediminihabitans sp.]